MPTLTTVYRAIVMIATGVIVVKGWQLYGPTGAQVKTFATGALEKAQAAWHDQMTSAPATTPAVPPAVILPNAAPPALPSTLSATPIATEAPQLAPIASTAPLAPSGMESASSAAILPEAGAHPQDVAALLTHLQQIGGADAQVSPWGSGGDLFRCCCRAKLEETSMMVRHFEAVAAEPTAAVEQVVAKVEAWRTEQQNLLR